MTTPLLTDPVHPTGPSPTPASITPASPTPASSPAPATASPRPTDDLVGQLETVFRLLGKRIYLPGLRALRAVATGPGVDKASYPLLALLEEHDDVRPSDAAAVLELDLSTVSRQVRHLESSGLLTRRPDDEDGRACRVRLTASGRSGLAAVRLSRNELLDSALGDWADTDRADLLRLLDRLLSDLRELPHPVPAPDSENAR